MALTLKVDDEQTALLRVALLEYQRSIRQQERYHCSGLSSMGISLCQRRLVLDSILSELDAQEHALHPGKKSKMGSIPVSEGCLHESAPDLTA